MQSNLWRFLGVVLLGLTCRCGPPEATTGSTDSDLSTNLVTNPGFESGLTGWGGWHSTLKRVSPGHTGSYAASVANAGSYTSYSIGQDPVVGSATAGHSYAGSAFIHVKSGKSVCLVLREWSSSGSVVKTASGCVPGTGAWEQIPTVTYTAQTTGDRIDLYVYQSSAASGDSFEIDDVSVRAGTSSVNDGGSSTDAGSLTDAGAPAVLSYESVTNWPRPAFTPTRTVSFTDATGLASALSGMQSGDLIQYAGTGVLTISAEYSNFSNHNPGAVVEIELGAANAANHVKFEYAGTSDVPAVYLHDSSNLRLYGGEMTSPNGGGGGILVMGNTHDVLWWDFVIHDVGSTGLSMFPTLTNGSDVSTIQRCSFRGEVFHWAQNLNWDPHAEKGTGLHGANLADVHNGTTNNSGSFIDNTVALYAHDAASGAGIEIGEARGSGSRPGDLHGNTVYCKAENLTMVAKSQVASNAFNLWGSVPYNELVIGWAEGVNLQGRVVDGQGLSCTSVSDNGQVTVQHGRHQNTNQNPYLSQTESNESPTQPYDDRWGIAYHDAL